VYVGDVLQFPRCALRVTAPREPCFKFNAVMGFAAAAKLMVQTQRCGFYLSVDQPGSLTAGDSFSVVPGRRALSIAQAIDGKRAKHAR
jgi:MOSC domain-containing protein YiiM